MCTGWGGGLVRIGVVGWSAFADWCDLSDVRVIRVASRVQSTFVAFACVGSSRCSHASPLHHHHLFPIPGGASRQGEPGLKLSRRPGETAAHVSETMGEAIAGYSTQLVCRILSETGHFHGETPVLPVSLWLKPCTRSKHRAGHHAILSKALPTGRAYVRSSAQADVAIARSTNMQLQTFDNQEAAPWQRTCN